MPQRRAMVARSRYSGGVVNTLAEPIYQAGVDTNLYADDFDRASGTITSGYVTRSPEAISSVSDGAGKSCIRFTYTAGTTMDTLVEKAGLSLGADFFFSFDLRLSVGADPTATGNADGYKFFMLFRSSGVRYTQGVGNLDGTNPGGSNVGLEFSSHDNGAPTSPNPLLQNVSKTPRYGTINNGNWHRYTSRIVNGVGGYEQIWVNGTLVLNSLGLGYDRDPDPITQIDFPGAIVNAATLVGFTDDRKNLRFWRH